MTEEPDGGSTQEGMPSFQVRIPLEWQSASDVPMVYVNQVMISHAGPEFFLVFGVVLPPDNPEQLPDSLRIKPQVRVVVSREAMPAIVKAMEDNLRRYRASLTRPGNPAAGRNPPQA